MKTQLKTFEYEGKIVEFCSYKGNLMFHLNSIGNILGMNRPDNSINTADAALALKLSNNMFENSQEVEILYPSEGISMCNRTLNNTGELFLTEAGLEHFLSKSRKPIAKKLLEWMFTNIPKIKEQIMTIKQTQTTDNKSVLINNVPVVFTEENDTIYVSSRDVAEVFEKRHDNVLQTISELPKDEFLLLNFQEMSYIDSYGRPQPEYRITRDGFSMLVMSFTGEKAYQWKKDFIAAFNKMEATLKQHFNKTQESISLESLRAQVALEEAKARQEEAKTQAIIKQAEISMNQLKLTTFSEIRDRYMQSSNDIGVRIYDNLITETLAGKPVVSDMAIKATELLYTATEVGKLLGISARKVGIIANYYGLKTKEYGEFFHERAVNVDKVVESFKYNEKGIEAVKEGLRSYQEDRQKGSKNLLRINKEE